MRVHLLTISPAFYKARIRVVFGIYVSESELTSELGNPEGVLGRS